MNNEARWKGREPDQHKITAVTGGFFVAKKRLLNWFYHLLQMLPIEDDKVFELGLRDLITTRLSPD
ncbi:hypothetical protein [Kluyvera georgiana]|uniref:hypothetical protein n=1 Tax=Kluyvera georgiana TaxID=73098 RepID=UPI000A82D917|nr:hypothetical protein [Kluyvera georgiana]